MKSNVNETELNILNNTQKTSIIGTIGNIIYYILKGILETIYIITCIVCTILEVLAWLLTLGTATKTILRRKRKRWY